MESTAKAKYLKTSPQKARLVADAVRGRMVGEALSKLQFGVKKSVSEDIAKLIKSAVANMQSKNVDSAIEPEDLRVTKIFVDGGPTTGRFRARAQGRVGRIIKRSCHISVTVSN